MDRNFWILVIMLSSLWGFSQSDSLDIQKFSNKVTVVPNYSYSNMYLKIFGKKTNIQYRPEGNHSVGLEASYKWLGLGFGLSVFDDTDNEWIAREVSYDIRVDIHARRLFVGSNFQYFRGFSIKDIPDNIPQDKVEEIRPNMDLINFGMNAIYAFNKKFSFRAIYKNDERMSQSRGSFLAGISQFYTRISSKSSFFPDELVTDDRIRNYSSFGKFYSVFADLGYQYAFVYKNWYAAPSFILGGGTQYQNYIYNQNIYKKEFRLALKYIISIPIGYNGDQFFYGVNFNYDYNRMQLNHARMQLQLTSLRVFFGMRLF